MVTKLGTGIVLRENKTCSFGQMSDYNVLMPNNLEDPQLFAHAVRALRHAGAMRVVKAGVSQVSGAN